MSEKKKPQDHKPKVEKVTVKVGDREAPGKRVKIDGVTVTVLDEALEDWETTENMALSADESASQEVRLIASVKTIRAVLGAEHERVKTELRAANDGKLNAEIINDFMTKVFQALNPNS